MENVFRSIGAVRQSGESGQATSVAKQSSVAHFEPAAGSAPARADLRSLIPTIDLDLRCVEPHLVALTRVDLTAAYEYDRLAVALMLEAGERRIRRVLVASAGRGDGRTSVAINLAAALAAARRRVLLVDVDLSEPALSRKLGLDTNRGLAEAVEHDLSLADVAIHTKPAGFDIVALREPVQNHLEALASPALHSLLATADDVYDFVLLDAPPLAEAAAASLLVRLADAALLVVRPGATTSLEMARAISPLSPDFVLGVVLNRVTRTSTRKM